MSNVENNWIEKKRKELSPCITYIFVHNSYRNTLHIFFFVKDT